MASESQDRTQDKQVERNPSLQDRVQDRSVRFPSPKPRVLIIIGDGLNCERETSWAFTLAGGIPDLVHIGDILRRDRRLHEYAALAFIGGFSNGDHLGAGTVQASRFRHALRDDLERFIGQRKPIIGICNGFQTLVKMGILPGPLSATTGQGAWERSATIMANESGKFEDRWVHLVINADAPCIWTRGLKRLFLPVRHGEGKYYMAEDGQLDALEQNNQVVARYATMEGVPTQAYPDNPNGSLRAIAAVCDASGLIFGLMPHPEAFISPYNHPSWTRESAAARPLAPEGEGLAIFRNAVEYLGGGM
ncbi:MAG: phosphoribosylformylglycinamidine synthase subunit PurQ [Spirochaetaceae bacterium]|nr:MAG: phosphoribosylformylglycinamidine synthase subunit PurQ [Spirochaetaceae bacterium]